MLRLTAFVLTVAASVGADVTHLQAATSIGNSFSKTAGCGNALFDNGVFSTPLHPALYPNDIVCTWTLTAPEGHVIRLVFTNFTVEYGVECSYDYVRIYNGPNSDAKHLAKTFCGAESLIEHVGGKVVTVVFKSNDWKQETGFLAWFHSISDPTLPAIQNQGQTTCGGDYQGSYGTIASPNYPNFYPNNLNCSYTITVPEGRVHLDFHHVDIEYHHTCSRDYVEIREENQSGKLLMTLCGSKLRKVSSTTQSLYLRFHSDYTLQGTGFYAAWKNTILQAITTKQPIPTLRQASSLNPGNDVDRTSTTPAAPTPVADTSAKEPSVAVGKIATTAVSEQEDKPADERSQATTNKLSLFTSIQPSSTDSIIRTERNFENTATQKVSTSTAAATFAYSTPVAAEQDTAAAATEPEVEPEEETTPKATTTKQPMLTNRQPSSTASPVKIDSNTETSNNVTHRMFTVAPTSEKTTPTVPQKSGTADPTEPEAKHEERTTQQVTADVPPTARVTQLVQRNTCITGGNVYAVVPGTGCSQFTQEAYGHRPVVHTCPRGLGFDLNFCVCTYFGKVSFCKDSATV